VISDCELYRYMLIREWDENLPRTDFIMLNPSTADEYEDDATIRKCISYAKSWGCGSVRVMNLFAIRATNPKYIYIIRLILLEIITIGGSKDVQIFQSLRLILSMSFAHGATMANTWEDHKKFIIFCATNTMNQLSAI